METTATTLLQGIDTILIRVSDIAKAKQWYTSALGLKPIWEDPNSNLVVFDTNGITSLTLMQSEQPLERIKETGTFPIFKTGDAAALKQLLEQRGVVTSELVEDEYVCYFTFHDDDGNMLEACQVKES